MGWQERHDTRIIAEAIRQAKLLFAPKSGNASTTGNASATQSGLVPPLPVDATKYLDGTGAWSTPAGGGGATAGYRDVFLLMGA